MNLSSESNRPVTVDLFPASEWPANLLRFHLRFSEPMDMYRSMQHVGLSRSNGSEVDGAMLDLPDAIWTADQRIMTILFHPGRLKTGLQARNRLGPILTPGTYKLRVSCQLKAVSNQALFDGASFQLQVHAPILKPPPPLAPQTVKTPRGSRQTICIDTAWCVDYLSVCHSLIAETLDGRQLKLSLEQAGTCIFINPIEPWPESRSVIRFRSTVEDVCGNRPNLPFESALEPLVSSRNDSIGGIIPKN